MKRSASRRSINSQHERGAAPSGHVADDAAKHTHSMRIRVRYVECDPMNVAHHSAHPVWFEMGRTELLRQAGMTYRDMEEQGVFLAVVHLDVRYKRPARYDDELQLHTTLTRMTGARIEHTYELYRDGELLATGSTTLCCLGRDGRPRLLPEEIVNASGF